MNTDDLSDLPDWDDELLSFDEDGEGEEWKPNLTRETCKAMYAQWQQVMFLLKGILQPVMEQSETTIEASMEIDAARNLQGDAYIVGAKIRSSEAGNIYILRMENAAVIRQLAQGIATGLLLFTKEDVVDESYIGVVRGEIDKFRLLFIEWVRTFEKDEFSDAWGLFI